MPKHTALALGIAFLIAGVVLIVFDQLVFGLALVAISAAFETLFAFALAEEHRKRRGASERT